MTMNRRESLRIGLLATGLMSISRPLVADENPSVITVRGPISPAEMGLTLPHEHVLVDFVGAAKVSPDRYKADEVFGIALPHLKRIHEQGIRTLVECTPPYLGRDFVLLRKLSEASGLHILAPTGYYGASGGKFIPDHARTETAEQIAGRWLAEFRTGEIRPGFIKLGADAGPLPEVHRKLVRAAALTHKQSGLTIAAHSGDGRAALGTLEILKEEGLSGSALIWVHANAEQDGKLHLQAARAGAWVEFDGIGPKGIDHHVGLVRAMKEAGQLNRVLLSHDAGWYHVGEPGGGDFRPYDTLIGEFVPALRKSGFTEAEIRQLTVENPREAFTVRKRLAR